MENDPNPYSTPGSDVFAGSSAVGGGGEITDGVLEQLRGTKGWVKFFAVMLFIGAAFLVLGGVLMMAGGAMGSAMGEEVGGGALGAGFGIVIGLIYIVMAILYIYPGVKLWKYGKGIDQLLQDHATVTLEAALNEQRAFWKFSGIALIVVLSIYAVAFIGLLLTMGMAFAG